MIPSTCSHRKSITGLPHQVTLQFCLDFDFVEVRNYISSVFGFVMAYGMGSDLWQVLPKYLLRNGKKERG